MGRLIDEAELIDIIQGSEELLDFQKEECINCIKACDTVYDLDEVIKQLERNFENTEQFCLSNRKNCELFSHCDQCAFDSALHIVKGGGVDG